MSSENSNQDLLDHRDLISDDPQAFATLIKRYQQPVFSFLGRMGFSQVSAEDLAQDSFLRVWKNRHRYDSTKGRVFTWIFTITRNLAINELRKASKTHSQLPEPSLVADTDPNSDPQLQLESEQARARLQRAINSLAYTDRVTIALTLADSLSAEECARLEDCSAASFRTRTSRAKARLINAYNDLESSNE